MAMAQGVPVATASEEQVAQASDHYLKAKEAFEASNFEAALQGFRASHAIVASPNARYMIVASLSELGRNVEGYREAEAGIPEAEAAALTDEKYNTTLKDLTNAKEKLRAKIGMLTVNVTAQTDASATLAIDGATVEPQKWGTAIPVAPGPHTVSLTGHDAQTVNVDPGGDASVEFATPTPEPTATVDVSTGDSNWFIENRRIFAYALGGVGVVGMGLFGVFGGLALSKQGDLDDTCTANKQCPTDSQGDIDDGQTFQVVANTMLVVGAVGLAAGVGLFVWDVLDEPSSEEGDELATLRVQAGPTGIIIGGSF
jgi:hypothetical protein